jgi:hypothetical protein
MADPREVQPQNRKDSQSPLMRALVAKKDGFVVNFCPFGCSDGELDDNGYCGHLVGFFNGGTTYEPRVRRKKDGRIIVDGRNRRPMEKGFKLVKITTSARVYSPTLVKDLAVKQHDFDAETAAIFREEQELLAQAERVRNPVLEGTWGETDYDAATPLAAAAAAK